MVGNYSMGRRTESRDLEIVMKHDGGDENFSAMVDGLDRGVVKRGKKDVKKLIYEFQVVWKGG